MSLTFFGRPLARLLLIAFVGMGASSLLATTVHVTLDGNDGNSGSAEQPVASLPKALELVSGKTEPSEIVIHQGVYPGGVQVGQQKDRDAGSLPPLLITAAKKADGAFEEAVLDGGRKIVKAE